MKKIKLSRGRGRPRIGILEYLALISMKYGVDSGEFFNSFIDAYKNQEAICGDLSIKCRKRTKDSAVFLITDGQRVVAQLSIPKHIFKNVDPIRKFTEALGKPSVKEDEARQLQIQDLRPGLKRINLKTKVNEIDTARLVHTRYGVPAYIANALLSDETGAIKISLWNKQIDAVSVGDTIQVEKTRVVKFRGERQLRVSRGGRLSVVEKRNGQDDA